MESAEFCRPSVPTRLSIRSLTDFTGLIAKLGEQTGEDTSTWTGYLNALRKARARFRAMGCTSTDHGHPTAQTADLPTAEAAALFQQGARRQVRPPQRTNYSAPRC